MDGVVIKSKYDGGFGNVIDIDHKNGFVSRYGHLSKRKVRVGDIVKKGDTIALSGNTGRTTGPHLHFQIWYNGILIDPYFLYPSYLYMGFDNL
jgi:murein DD-endopeptidase MepM/ murein hydrolase activator NlpD